MEIYWDNLPEGCEKLLTDLVKKGMKHVNAPEPSEISISFVDKKEIRRLNLEYRGIDKETDVLSFPVMERKEWETAPIVPLGDIVICTDTAKEQAEGCGHSFERELGFLTVHGFLHLAGYDHMDTNEEEKMRDAQREILGDLI